MSELHQWFNRKSQQTITKPGIERVQALADISHSLYVVVATKPVHWLQIRPVCTTRGHRLPFLQVTSGSVQ